MKLIFWSSQTSHDFSGFRWHPSTPFWVSPHRLPPSLPQPAPGDEHLSSLGPLKGMDRWKIWKPVKAGEIDLNWWPIKIENSRKLWGKRRWTNEAHKVQNARLTGFPMSMFSWETSRNAPTLTQSGKHSAGQHSAGQHSAARSGRRSRSHSCQKSAAVWSLTCHLEHGSSNVF